MSDLFPLYPAMFLYPGQGTMLGAWCPGQTGVGWDIKIHYDKINYDLCL